VIEVDELSELIDLNGLGVKGGGRIQNVPIINGFNCREVPLREVCKTKIHREIRLRSKSKLFVVHRMGRSASEGTGELIAVDAWYSRV
jgi:hypothetical protein